MGIFDFFNKKHKGQPQQPGQKYDLNQAKSKQELYQMLFANVAQDGPSKLFTETFVLDVVRSKRTEFESIVRANDVSALRKFLSDVYVTLCINPGSFGFPPAMVDAGKNDTNPDKWITGIYNYPDGCAMGLCYMPLRDDKLKARIIGILVHGDYNYIGHYYCMLSKDESVPTEVWHHESMVKPEMIGEVKERGMDLMNGFRNIIKENYSAELYRRSHPDHL